MADFDAYRWEPVERPDTHSGFVSIEFLDDEDADEYDNQVELSRLFPAGFRLPDQED